MNDRVYMVHPKLPGQPIRVRPGAVNAYQRAGWRPAEEPEPEETADLAEAEQPRARRRRATPEPPADERTT